MVWIIFLSGLVLWTLGGALLARAKVLGRVYELAETGTPRWMYAILWWVCAIIVIPYFLVQLFWDFVTNP